ncbi:uncharacterized protein LOC113798585 [Dermatophagoides pteronyssinus]|uniref:uncharacterized protein LOC113798585 n=1 Tax=Dermatophagoides pteronyssinus TaxID=6956 RepID=UPI003F66E410
MKLDFRQKPFAVGYKNSLPFVNIIDHTKQSAHGIEPRLLFTLASYFNFTIEYNHYGNKTWIDLYTGIEQGEIDFGIGGTMMTSERNEKFHFLYPHFLERVTFAILRPHSHVNRSLRDMIAPFDNIVWICLILLFVSIFLLNHLFRYDYRKQQTNHHHNLVWIFVQQLLRQPNHHFRSLNLSMKITTIVCIFMIGIVFTNVYIGNLCSRLTLPPNIDLDTIEKFAEECRTNDKIITMGIAHTHINEIIQTSEIATFHAASKRMIYVNSVMDGYEKILNINDNEKQYAMIGPRERLHYRQLQINNGKSIYVPPNNGDSHFFTMYIAIPVHRTFVDRHTFDTFILGLSSYGMFEHWKNQEYFSLRYHHSYTEGLLKNSNVENQSNDDDDVYIEEIRLVHPLSMNNLYSIFKLYAILMLMAFIKLIVEICSILIQRRHHYWH